MTSDRFRHKWWGWGIEGASYDIESRPGLPPFIRSMGVDVPAPNRGVGNISPSVHPADGLTPLTERMYG